MPEDELFKHTKVLPEVWEALSASDNQRVTVIVRPADSTTPEQLRQEIERKVKGAADLATTDYFVRVTVDRAGLGRLEEHAMVDRVWHDKRLKGQWQDAAQTVKAQPARSLFGATGKEIAWAVLDTGVRATHKYFAGPKGVKQYLVARDTAYNFAGGAYRDGAGHGTHVAGIIRKIAPECELYDFRVLDAKGYGSSFATIQAMETIRHLNQRPNGPVIHGANLSLGGPAPVASYAVGHSPECQEANRLVDSGVVVCVAASNDGYKDLATVVGSELESFPTFMDIGIADPGNAEDVITVGSTHKTKPHTYGPSYFSSRGPTGDGRPKPDLLAPGEKIISASHENDSADVEMSGTSMATPVVSGVVALFLSAYREFIGRPRDVKRLLMETCTDLGRDRYFQGAGLVDALRLLQAA